jgi:hypothetical protein
MSSMMCFQVTGVYPTMISSMARAACTSEMSIGDSEEGDWYSQLALVLPSDEDKGSFEISL